MATSKRHEVTVALENRLKNREQAWLAKHKPLNNEVINTIETQKNLKRYSHAWDKFLTKKKETRCN